MSVTVDQLVEANYPLVGKVVRAVTAGFPSHADRDEFISAGNLGLFEAARRFDPSRGVAFPAFAAQRIRGAVLDAARDADHAPRSVRSRGRELAAAAETLTAELDRTPSDKELADRLGITTERLARIRHDLHRGLTVSLDAPTSTDGTATLADVIGADPAADPLHGIVTDDSTAELWVAVDQLPSRQQHVVRALAAGRTLRDIGTELGVTESRVCQIKGQAVDQLADLLRPEGHPMTTAVQPWTPPTQAQLSRVEDLIAKAKGMRQTVKLAEKVETLLAQLAEKVQENDAAERERRLREAEMAKAQTDAARLKEQLAKVEERIRQLGTSGGPSAGKRPKRQYSEETLARMRENAARMRQRKAAKQLDAGREGQAA